ncbi:MAG: helix-turn-helix domain-containing protein [Haloarculaceae archaeon]
MTDGTAGSKTTVPPEVRELPPSAKLVAKTLAYEGELTQAQLTEETLLPGRTVRHALTLLEEEGVVTSQISFMDARQQIYALDVDGGE